MNRHPECFAGVRHVLEDGELFFVGELPSDLTWDSATFDEVWSLHPTPKHRITIHGREVETPRWQQAYGADYHYTGTVNRAMAIPDVLVPLLRWATHTIDARLNGILCNWYDGPTHYIGPHRDSIKNMVYAAPIVTLSFGETRAFRLSRGKGATRTVREFQAANGTVFVMPYSTNLSWKHDVKKSTRYRGRRISVTIRALHIDDAMND